MDDHHLRSILLNLNSRLSDNDRERLHFYLHNDAPRPLIDDSSLSGTLKLMQSLFDQDKINENDFTFLIKALKQIQCFDAVKLLKEHQRRMQLTGWNQSVLSLASVMPLTNLEVIYDDQEDKMATDQFHLNKINSENQQNHNINTEAQTLLSPRKQNILTFSSKKKSFIFLCILLGLTLMILIVIVIGGMKYISNLKEELQSKQSVIDIDQEQNNQTMDVPSDKNTIIQRLNRTIEQNNQLNSLLEEKEKVIRELNQILRESSQQQNHTKKQFTDLLSDKNTLVEQLNKTLIDLQKQRKVSFVKAGQIFGGDGGDEFDDSTQSNFTSHHYLSGIVLFTLGEIDSCHFIYTSSQNNQTRIESPLHGPSHGKKDSAKEYHLNDDERIEEILVRASDVFFRGQNNTVNRVKVIKGLQFITTKGRQIPPDIDLTDDGVTSEHIPGYTLGYATGKTGSKIDQLQFFWYRTKR